MNPHSPYSNGRRLGTLLSWDPARLLDDLARWEPAGSQTVWSAYPSPVNVQTSEDGATITMDMPGVDPADLDLTFANGTLAISGKRGEQIYRYSVALGDAIDPDQIEAELDKGVLTVHAHKKAEAKPRKIQLKPPAKTLDSGDKK
jgi:HSP20 family protein